MEIDSIIYWLVSLKLLSSVLASSLVGGVGIIDKPAQCRFTALSDYSSSSDYWLVKANSETQSGR